MLYVPTNFNFQQYKRLLCACYDFFINNDLFPKQLQPEGLCNEQKKILM